MLLDYRASEQSSSILITF